MATAAGVSGRFVTEPGIHQRPGGPEVLGGHVDRRRAGERDRRPVLGDVHRRASREGHLHRDLGQSPGLRKHFQHLTNSGQLEALLQVYELEQMTFLSPVTEELQPIVDQLQALTMEKAAEYAS